MEFSQQIVVEQPHIYVAKKPQKVNPYLIP